MLTKQETEAGIQSHELTDAEIDSVVGGFIPVVIVIPAIVVKAAKIGGAFAGGAAAGAAAAVAVDAVVDAID